MNNQVIKDALNGVAIAAANYGDMDTVSKLEQVAQFVTSITPQGRFLALGADAYDATAASSTAFLDFAGGMNNIEGISTPQFDTQAETVRKLWPTTQPAVPGIWLLGG